MEGGDKKGIAFMDGLEVADCLFQYCVSVAQIGAEGDAGAHEGF